VPGCALECVVRTPGSDELVAIWNVYLPPSDRQAVLTELEGCTPPPGTDLYIAGDFNIHMAAGRGNEEEALLHRLRATLIFQKTSQEGLGLQGGLFGF
jgi:hypothetical protein